MLAPTGKAALRARMETDFENVQTIDRWIYTNGLGEFVEDLSALSQMPASPDREVIENLVIDEMSMVNLAHLAVILRAIEVQGIQTVRRVILIGDENQLAHATDIVLDVLQDFLDVAVDREDRRQDVFQHRASDVILVLSCCHSARTTRDHYLSVTVGEY